MFWKLCIQKLQRHPAQQLVLPFCLQLNAICTNQTIALKVSYAVQLELFLYSTVDYKNCIIIVNVINTMLMFTEP